MNERPAHVLPSWGLREQQRQQQAANARSANARRVAGDGKSTNVESKVHKPIDDESVSVAVDFLDIVPP